MIFFISPVASLTVYTKPICQGFNYYDNKETIVFTDDNAGDRYTVSNVKLIPSWGDEESQYLIRTLSRHCPKFRHLLD